MTNKIKIATTLAGLLLIIGVGCSDGNFSRPTDATLELIANGGVLPIEAPIPAPPVPDKKTLECFDFRGVTATDMTEANQKKLSFIRDSVTSSPESAVFTYDGANYLHVVSDNIENLTIPSNYDEIIPKVMPEDVLAWNRITNGCFIFNDSRVPAAPVVTPPVETPPVGPPVNTDRAYPSTHAFELLLGFAEDFVATTVAISEITFRYYENLCKVVNDVESEGIPQSIVSNAHALSHHQENVRQCDEYYKPACAALHTDDHAYIYCDGVISCGSTISSSNTIAWGIFCAPICANYPGIAFCP